MEQSMDSEKSRTILKDFYMLCHNNTLNTNYDLFDLLEKNFIVTYPEVRLFSCDNDTFSSSLLVAIPLGESRIALMFLDQHNSDIVRINFSYNRFLSFSAGLNEMGSNLKKSSKD